MDKQGWAGYPKIWHIQTVPELGSPNKENSHLNPTSWIEEGKYGIARCEAFVGGNSNYSHSVCVSAVSAEQVWKAADGVYRYGDPANGY